MLELTLIDPLGSRMSLTSIEYVDGGLGSLVVFILQQPAEEGAVREVQY